MPTYNHAPKQSSLLWIIQLFEQYNKRIKFYENSFQSIFKAIIFYQK